jgi:hypothetical protein
MNSPSLATSSSLLVFLSRNQLPRSWPNKLNFGVRACAMFGHAFVLPSAYPKQRPWFRRFPIRLMHIYRLVMGNPRASLP